MSFLKGNYELDKTVGSSEPKHNEETVTATEAFERFARQRLGGSIAFVMKQNTFVWRGDDAESARKEQNTSE